MHRRNFVASVAAAAAAAPLLVPASANAATARVRASASASGAVVDAVQMPAWVERAGERLPLAPGAHITTADEVRTGAGAALVLRLPEGSIVRLGEKTRLGVLALEANERAGRIAVASELKLFDGFFRFATSAVAKAAGERRIDVALRTATVGIRGTDFWSMTDEEHDASCLFEGKVELATRDQGPLVLDQPTAFWARFFQRPVQPVGNATPQQLATFLGSTELSPGRGIAVAAGRWRVVALVTPDARQALRVGGRLRAEGYPAVVRSAGGVHSLAIESLASEMDAQAVAARIAQVEGVQARAVLGA